MKKFILLPLLLVLPTVAAAVFACVRWGDTVLALLQTFVKAVLLP